MPQVCCGRPVVAIGSDSCVQLALGVRRGHNNCPIASVSSMSCMAGMFGRKERGDDNLTWRVPPFGDIIVSHTRWRPALGPTGLWQNRLGRRRRSDGCGDF